MPTRGNGVGAIVHEVAERVSALARLEAELASLELRRKAASLGAGGALIAGALLLSLFALGFLFATIVAALATFLPTWLALLLVGAVLMLSAAAAGWIGVARLRRGMPLVPAQAVQEAKLTAEALKGNGRG
jgi:uncharacterized membrane protein YqjE